MKVVTAEQIRELDRRAIGEAGIPGAVLMENAGRAVLDVIEREVRRVAGARVAVFCGAGNNGGDGFVVLRLLRLAGARAELFCPAEALDETRLKPDAAAHMRAARVGQGLRSETLPDAAGLADGSWPDRFDLAVDALLGTGIKDAPRGWYAEAIRAVNALRCPIVAVDMPSGIDSDTGAAPGEAVRAQWTVTFGLPKLGLFLYPGYEHAGRLHISDIGFLWTSLPSESEIVLLGCGPRRLTAGVTCSPSLRAPMGWEKLLQKRRPESNKGDYGHVGIVAGSRGMAGAPALVARAAQRSGAGLVTVLSPESAQPLIAATLDEQMTKPLPERDGALAEAAWDPIQAFARKATVLCIGPGLTTAPETVRLVLRLVREIDAPIVLDADGLNALASEPAVAIERSAAGRGPLVITPHPGEAARLLGTSIAQVQSDRIGSVRELARRYAAVALLKGRHTLIADTTGAVCINTTGNPGMASGGMGDTLTGIVGAMAAQDFARRPDDGGPATPLLFAVCLAVHVHGIAGDIAAGRHGEAGLTASDVIDRVPEAISSLTEDV